MPENNQITNDAIIQGLDDTLVKSFRAAYSNRHDAVWKEIVKFMNNQLMLAFGAESLALSKHFIRVPARFMEICLEQDYETEKVLTELCAGYDDLKFFLPPKADDLGSDASKITMNYYESVATFYFQTLKLKNYDLLETALVEFNKLNQSGVSANLHQEIRKTQYKMTRKVDQDDILTSLELRFIRPLSHRRIGLAIQSWGMYLLSLKKMDLERSRKIYNQVNPRYGSMLDVLTDAVYIRRNVHTGYLGLREWDHTQRKPGKSYTPPVPNDWIIFGTCFQLMNDAHLSTDIDEIPENDDYLFLLEAIKDCLTKIENDWKTWASIFGAESDSKTIDGEDDVFLENFRSRRRIIMNLAGRLKNRQQAIKDFKIADQNLDVARVEEYKRRAGEQWIKNIRALSYFDIFRNLTVHKEVTGLELLGKKYLLKGFKMMFVENDYQQIYGSADIGGEMARMMDGFFISKINSKDLRSRNYADLEVGLNQSIEELRTKKYKPSLIIIPPEFIYRTNILKLPGFKPSDNQNAAEDFGSYDGIPVTTLYTPELQNEVFVLDFSASAKLDIYESPERLFKRLHLEIKSLTDEEVEEIFTKDHKSWRNISTGDSLSDVEVKLKIATSVYMEIWINAQVSISDLTAIRKFTVNDLSDS